MTPVEVKVLLDGLVGHSLHPIASLALASGLRRGELLALEWKDIDLDSAQCFASSVHLRKRKQGFG